MKTFISLLLTCLVIMYPIMQVFSQEEPKVVDLKKGDVAPWDGSLLNAEAVAKIVSDYKTIKEMCILKIEEIIELERARCDKDKEDIVAELEAERRRTEIMLVAKEREILELQSIIEDDFDDEIWWFVGGVGAGAILAGGIAALVVYAND